MPGSPLGEPCVKQVNSNTKKRANKLMPSESLFQLRCIRSQLCQAIELHVKVSNKTSQCQCHAQLAGLHSRLNTAKPTEVPLTCDSKGWQPPGTGRLGVQGFAWTWGQVSKMTLPPARPTEFPKERRFSLL